MYDQYDPMQALEFCLKQHAKASDPAVAAQADRHLSKIAEMRDARQQPSGEEEAPVKPPPLPVGPGPAGKD